MTRLFRCTWLIGMPAVLLLFITFDPSCQNLLMKIIRFIFEALGVYLSPKQVKTLNYIAFFAVVGLLFIVKMRDSVRLSKERKKLDGTLRELMRIACYSISNQLVSSVSLIKRHDLRVSLYIISHNKCGIMMGFECCGRYSFNNAYNNPGRSIYPKDQGVIANAWDQGEAVMQFSVDKEMYYIEMSRIGYDRNEVDNFTMKPHFIFAKRIQENIKPPSGLIVVELANRVDDNEDLVVAEIEKQIAVFSHVLLNFGEKFVELSAIRNK